MSTKRIHFENTIKGSALKVNQGIDQPPSINEGAAKAFAARKQGRLSVDDYVDGITGGSRTILGKAITLVESSLDRDYHIAQKIVNGCMPFSGNSIRVGVSGVPGVGKSTFIEALGMYLVEQGNKVAVLAVDPSSQVSKGSILGDKTRMEQLSASDSAFIRPSPSAGSLGGVARKTREIIILCEAAGFNVVLVETVGVGQSETAVHSMVDFFLLMMLAGAGDELQGIKRGIMEMCDGMVINKADGDNLPKAMAAKGQYQNALHLFPLSQSGWRPKVEVCSAIQGTGIDSCWNMILEYQELLKSKELFDNKRKQQQVNRLLETINQELLDHFYKSPSVKDLIPVVMQKLEDNSMQSYQAAEYLLKRYFNQNKPETNS